VVAGGRPVISGEGALIGGWRTMVEAVDVHTSGLGGDSEIQLDRQIRLCVGPRKALPLSLLASRFPGVLADLERMAGEERVPAHPAHFALRNPGRAAPERLSPLEKRVWESLTPEPKRVSSLTRSGAGWEALRRLADAGLAAIAAFTPSDAMHVLGRQHDWSRAAAEYGARILATEERNARAVRIAVPAEELAARVHEHVVRASGRALIDAALAADPGLSADTRGWGTLGARLIEETVAGRRFSELLDVRLGVARPLVAIGAPVGAYYPEVARRLGATLSIPAHAAVCNAVGAVAGVVSQTVDVLVNQTALNSFRVHDPAGSKDYSESGPALEHARRASRDLALAAARRAGAADPHVETSVTERRADLGSGEQYLAEAVARSVATGRPLAGLSD
jgi:N-methylhydantoinase A/oxoprolinase/acetone carboxylase beta subunit